MILDSNGSPYAGANPLTAALPIAAPQHHLIEIARSFSFKLNAGNYESRDFFCSQKAECSPEDADETSERLYQFCKAQVMKAVREYREEVESEAARGRREVNERRSQVDQQRLLAARRIV